MAIDSKNNVYTLPPTNLISWFQDNEPERFDELPEAIKKYQLNFSKEDFKYLIKFIIK